MFDELLALSGDITATRNALKNDNLLPLSHTQTQEIFSTVKMGLDQGIILFVVSLLLWARAYSTAQILPGVGRPNHGAGASLAACSQESNRLLGLALIHQEILYINHRAEAVSLDDETVCHDASYGAQEDTTTTICSLDYATFEHDLKRQCENHNGKYRETKHTIKCTARASSSSSIEAEPQPGKHYVVQLLYFPDCFGTDCRAPDIQRVVARDLRRYEKGLELQLLKQDDPDSGHYWSCQSEYDIEEDSHMMDGTMQGEKKDEERFGENEVQADVEKETMTEFEGLWGQKAQQQQDPLEQDTSSDDLGEPSGNTSLLARDAASSSFASAASLATLPLLLSLLA
jgi:hypothetical protein